jgi:hypothetical protein
MEDIMIYVVFGFISMFACALVAAGKQRSTIGWMTAGFFFPIIAFVAILCLPALATPDPQPDTSRLGQFGGQGERARG